VLFRSREKFHEQAGAAGIELFLPPPVLCSDNAAMVAVLGTHLLNRGFADSLALNAVSRWPLQQELP
jgi:N6-L-threonylcarbamoyladenine synthase